MTRLVLVDGTALVYRAYFAIPGNLSTAEGRPTNAVYGFALMFQKLFAGRKPDYGAVIFDAPGRTFRDEQYADYKSDRAPMEDDLAVQLPDIQRVVDAQRFPTLKVPGYEADDVIGTLTAQAVEAGFEVLIVSGDKDFSQLVSPSVKMLDPMRDITYDVELVRKKWGVPPEHFVDLLALMGDKIDSIPGVPGIGKKGAAQLLEEFGSLAAMLEDPTKLPKRYATKLAEHADDARLSRDLARIDRKVPLELGPQDLALPGPDLVVVDTLYKELEFFSLLAEPTGETEADAAAVLTDPAALQAWLQQGPFALEPVVDGDHAVFGALVGVGLARPGSAPRYVPMQEGLREMVEAALLDPEREIDVHDVKRAGHAFGLEGLPAARFDTMLASFLYDPNKVIPHRLEQLGREFLQRSLTPEKRYLGGGKSKKAFTDLEPSQVAAYAGERAQAVADLGPILREKLAEVGLTEHYRTQERALADVLLRMERVGIGIDVEELTVISDELERRLSEIEAEVHALAGRAFNIASTKQLSAVLFDELKLPVIKRTKTGYSTASDVLERLAPQHPIANAVLEHRKVSKLISTYTNVLRAAVRPETGRVHASFQQTVGVTGRLISTDPDLQRTPIRTPEGKRIRRAFVARPGCKLVSADWSQIELRLLAHVSGDETLRAAFAEGADVHARTAAALFDVAVGEVDEAQRRIGKTVNFATVYGQGANALGQILGIPKAEAQGHIDAYFALYAGVRRWLDDTIAAANETGSVRTLFGRVRHIPELSSHSFMDQQAGQRIAANTPIQGSAADLCKKAMLDVHAALRAEDLRAELLMQIHDELVFEVPEAEVDRVVAIARAKMSAAYPLDVPLVVDVGVGDSWAEAH